MSDVPVRPVAVPDPRIYVSDISVAPGEEISAHVTSPAEYVTSMFRLDPESASLPVEEARNRSKRLTERASRGASPHPIRPGSYMWVEGAPPAGPEITLGAWVRLWRLPSLDVVQWAWSAVVSDFDYPYRCRFALLIDHAGRVGLYAGGGTFDHGNLLLADTDLGSRLGQWVHLVGAVDVAGSARIYVDGAPSAEGGPVRIAPPDEDSRVRVAASAEGGRVDGFLDADLAQAFVAESAVDTDTVLRLARDQALSPMEEILSAGHRLWGHWSFANPADRYADVSGAGNHGQSANHPVAAIGGPAYDPSDGGPGYDPAADPRRGSAVRFASDDLVDAGWPAALTWSVPDDAPSGIYAARLQLRGQDVDDSLHVPFVVSRRTPRRPDSVALLCATNTWLAYGRRPHQSRRAAGMESSFYSTHSSGNPFFHVGTRLPLPQLDPFGYESRRSARMNHSHLVRPELYAQAWLERNAIPYEVVADSALHAEPALLERFRVLLIAGHNEYWSDEMWSGIDHYLRGGGQVVSLSGNTGHWRVTLDLEERIIESRKVVDGHDERWLSPDTWGDRWHCHGGGAGGRFLLVDRPAHRLLGTDTQGMIDDGTPTAFAGFEVIEPDHPLFHEPTPVPLGVDGVIGLTSANGPAASGYEFDATALRLGEEDELPAGLTVLASAFGQPNLEWNGVERDHGGDIVYWERPDGGTVFVVGSIGATGALLADEPMGILVGNVLRRFGVPVTR